MSKKPSRSNRHPIIGRKLGGYHILEFIGRGSTGKVYRARQVSLDRDVAFKILHPALATQKRFIQEFEHEAHAAGKLNHEAIVQVFDVGSIGPLRYISMDFMEGGNAKELLEEEGPLDIAKALGMIRDITSALAYAQSAGILHRDVKPANMLLDDQGTAKLADLGISQPLHALFEERGEDIAGSPHYMSPEQALGKPLDIRSDIYSLGASFFQLLTGRTVFQKESIQDVIAAHLGDARPCVCDLRPEIPARVAETISRMLARDPEKRFQSVADLQEHLQALAESLEKNKRSSSRASIAPITRRRSRQRSSTSKKLPKILYWIIGIAVLLAIYGTLVCFFGARWCPFLR